MTVSRMIPDTDYAGVPSKQSTGRGTTLYVLPSAVTAVQDVDSSSCRILLTGAADWIQVDMAGLDFIKSIKGVIVP